AELGSRPRTVNRPQCLPRRAGLLRLICIWSREEGTAASPPMGTLSPHPWPVLGWGGERGRGQASGFRPDVVGVVGHPSPGTDWRTGSPDLFRTALRLSLSFLSSRMPPVCPAGSIANRTRIAIAHGLKYVRSLLNTTQDVRPGCLLFLREYGVESLE